jgi:hypothetical protein
MGLLFGIGKIQHSRSREFLSRINIFSYFLQSHAINAYLVNKYAKDDSLYPKDPQKRAIVDQRLHFDSGVLFPRMRDITVGFFCFVNYKRHDDYY